jgi:phytoene desaturase
LSLQDNGKRTTVIGAGIGGLAAACLFAAEGHRVTVYEKNSTAGGKMQQLRKHGYRFDTGPSLFTMPFQLEKLFEQCGEKLENYLSYTDLEPLARYFFQDGLVFDNYQDKEVNATEIEKFAPESIKEYNNFLKRAEKLYRKTSDAFLFNPLYSFRDFKKLKYYDFLGIDAFSTVSQKVDKSITSPHLRQFFKRFTTYNGSSPFKAPATLNVIPHVELNQGGFYVKKGMIQIVEALLKLGKKLGVQYHYNHIVHQISIKKGSVNGIYLKNGTYVESDVVIANSDATDTILNLLENGAVSNSKKAKQARIEPSCSGFVLMMGCRKRWSQLRHHNVFFSKDYKKEFEEIFEEKHLPQDPTIYIANTSWSDPDDSPVNSSNLFVLVNAPYVNENQNWEELSDRYSSFIIEELERRGLDGLEKAIEVLEIINPRDFLELYRSNRGSIYGTSSNDKFSAFMRPKNKLKGIQNLFLVGGSTHPGGGIPLVIQSAFNAFELMKRNNL